MQVGIGILFLVLAIGTLFIDGDWIIGNQSFWVYIVMANIALIHSKLESLGE
jgi:hypothetical protein